METNRKVSCWITGAHGFIGRHLSQYLALCGWRVAGIGHGAWAPNEARAWGVDYWLNGEVGIANLVQLAREWGSPEVVFHLAGGSSVGGALANPLEDFRRTVVSTAELLEWLRQNTRGARLVAVSSAAVYGAGHDGRIVETARTLPYSTYGVHKLMMEDLCRSYAKNYGLSVVLPRLFSVYGCGLRKQLLWDLCEKINSGKTVELGGTGNEVRDWIDVRDVVQSLKVAASHACIEAPVINLGSGQGTAIREVAVQIGIIWAAFGRPLPTIRFNGQQRLGDPFSLVADVKKSEEALRFKRSLPTLDGFADYINWYLNLRQFAHFRGDDDQKHEL